MVTTTTSLRTGTRQSHQRHNGRAVRLPGSRRTFSPRPVETDPSPSQETDHLNTWTWLWEIIRNIPRSFFHAKTTRCSLTERGGIGRISPVLGPTVHHGLWTVGSSCPCESLRSTLPATLLFTGAAGFQAKLHTSSWPWENVTAQAHK